MDLYLYSSDPTLKRYILDASFEETRTIQRIKMGHREKRQKWKMVRSLGRGAFGQVRQERWRNRHGDLHYRAVKVCFKETVELARIDLVRELSALVALSSSRYSGLFLNLFGYWIDSQNLYIATEYISGGDLSKYTTQNLSEADIREIVEGILNGLVIMHQEGFTHRDIKPQNILVVQRPPESKKWWVKIADFGISKRILEENQTSLHTCLGTRPYCAPEILGYSPQSEKTSVYTNKVDMWSLGCVLFNISSNGYTPFSEAELWRYCYGHLSFNPQQRQLGLETDGLSLLKACLNPDPMLRPSAADALQHPWFTLQVDLSSQIIRMSELSLDQRPDTVDLEPTARPVDYNSFLLQSTSSNSEEPNISQELTARPVNYNSFLLQSASSSLKKPNISRESTTGSVNKNSSLSQPTSSSPEEPNIVAEQTTGLVNDHSSLSQFTSSSSVEPSMDRDDLFNTDSSLRESNYASSSSPQKEILTAIQLPPTPKLRKVLPFFGSISKGYAQIQEAGAMPMSRYPSIIQSNAPAQTIDPPGQIIAPPAQAIYTSLELLQTLFDHGEITAVAFSPDGRLIATVAQAVTIWDRATGRALHSTPEVTRHPISSCLNVLAIAFSRDRERLLFAHSKFYLSAMDVRTGEKRDMFKGNEGGLRHLASFSSDGRLVAFASLAGGPPASTIKVWDAEKRHMLRKLDLGTTCSNPWSPKLAISPDGQLIALVVKDITLGNLTIGIWDVATGKCQAELTEDNSGECSRGLVFSPCGRLLVAVSSPCWWSCAIAAWDVATRKVELRFELRDVIAKTLSVALSPDGRLLAATNFDRGVSLYNTEGMARGIFKEHTGCVTAVAFSPIGSVVASGDSDGSVKIWKAL